MNKVFIVTSGYYSDYQIQAVFSSEERAKEYINANGTDYDWEVNEYELDSESTKCHEDMYNLTIDVVSGNVSVNGREEQGTVWYKYDIVRKDCFQYVGSQNVRMWLESNSIEHVKKVASERWMQIKALQPVVFSYLYEKVVCNGQNSGLPCHDYPMYNFFTKKIILSDTQKLDIRYTE